MSFILIFKLLNLLLESNSNLPVRSAFIHCLILYETEIKQ